MKYAIVYDNAIREYRHYEGDPPACRNVNGVPVLRPVRLIPLTTAFDPATQKKDITIEVTDTEVIEREVAVPKTADEINAAIKMQIADLERGQGRALREAALGMAGAQERLTALDAQAVALRAKFVP